MKPDKVHLKKNIVTETSSTWRKVPIDPRERNKPHGTTPHDERLENSHANNSNGEK